MDVRWIRQRGTERRTHRLLIGVVAATLALSACSGGGTGTDDGAASTETAGEATGEAAASGEETTLVVAVPELGTENWAPHRAGGSEQAVIYPVMERLIGADHETREYTPRLVESWEPNEDYTAWTFKLRQDVPFHEGPDGQDYGTMTAEDVKFTYSLYLRDDSLFGRSDAYRALVDDNVDNFEIIDDHTFRLNMPEPNAIVPALFTSSLVTLSVTSKAYWEEVGEEQASRHPIGTGPWRFESHEPGTSVQLSAVEDHWRKTPGFDNLEFRIIPDPAAQLAQLRTGEVDFSAISLDLVPQAEQEGLQIISVPNIGVSSLYLGGHYPDSEFYDEDSPWIQADNPEQGRAIREAMSLAIDREAIVNDLLGGEGMPVIGPVHYAPGIPATDPEWVGDGAQVPEYDPERARELLAEGGYPDGFDAEQISFEQSGMPFSTDISAAIESMLSDIGINVNHRPVTEAQFDEMREDRASEGVFWQYVQNLAVEPGDRMSAFLPEDGGAEFFFDPMRDYVERMQQQPDFEERMSIARELGQEMVDYVGPAIGIAAVNGQWVAGPDIADWEYISGVTEIHNTEYIEPSS